MSRLSALRSRASRAARHYWAGPTRAIFVDPLGSDANDGTRDSPYATLHRALARVVEENRASPWISREINLAAGIYRMDSPAFIGPEAADGGAALTIRGVGEQTILTGCRPVPAQAVEDADGRLWVDVPDRPAVPLDLGTFGFAMRIPHAPPMVFAGGKRLDWARGSFDPQLAGAAFSRGGEHGAFTVSLAVDPVIAKQLTGEPAVWAEFVLGESWNWFTARLVELDAANGLLHTDLSCGELAPGTRAWRIRFQNVGKALRPGQCVLEPQRRRIVLWPKIPADAGDVELCINPAPIIQIAAASAVGIEGLAFRGGLAGGVFAEKCSSIAITSCSFRDLGLAGIDATGERISVVDCDIHDVGTSGIRLTSGDPRTLAPGRSQICRCHVSRWSQWKPVYEPAIRLRGVGSVVDACTIENGPHMAIEISGNDHVVRRSVFRDVVREFADMGAIYLNTGLHPLMRGNLVEANVFRGFGARHDKNHAVYSDNSTHGLVVRQNLFVDIGNPNGLSAGVYANGPSCLLVSGNLFIDCSTPLEVQFYLADWGQGSLPEYRAAREQALLSLAAGGAAHLKAYPELASLAEESVVYPATSRFFANTIWSPTRPMPFGPWRIRFGPVSLVGIAGNAVFAGSQKVESTQNPLVGLIAGNDTASALAAIDKAVAVWPETCLRLGLVEP